MLDEPFGSLDRTLRERLLSELRGILENLKQTALYVTHDQEEAFALADRVVVMAPGEIAQVGTPESIYSKPASVFVARFLGLSNIFTGKRSQDLIQTPVGDFTIQGPPFTTLANGQAFTLLVRPDRMGIAFAENGKTSQSVHLQGVIREITFRGSIYQVRLDVNGFELRLDFPSRSRLPGVGSQLRLSYNPQETIQILD
jgi:ABC-type Fe3+/spermidine/putrescine transport system ATPase subunit